MSVKSQESSVNSHDQAAGDWVARLDAGDLTQAEQDALQAWLDSDSRCVGAFARARAIFISPRIASAIQDARHSNRGAAISSLPAAPLASPVARRSFLAAAAAAAVGAAFLLEQREHPARHVYVSELGEIRQIPLPDGSRITLNTNSALQVEYRAEARLITLQRGEAYFEVAKNPERPFIVVGSSAQARAVGTAYSVRLGEEDGQMQIRVMTGRVAVEPPTLERVAAFSAIKHLFGSESTHGAYLNANQEADVRVGKDGPDRGKIQVSIRDLLPGVFERSLMWREGLLSFEGVTLAEAIAEFARYSAQKIVLRDSLAQERISGLFAAADPAAFSRAIAISLQAKIKTENHIIILYR
jgi:transmembrane sensor